MALTKSELKQLLSIPVIVAALGYFVDIYDLLLFSIIRKTSLSTLGVTTDAEQFSQGEFLLQVQMGGLLIGGVIWGIMGDKRGRLSVLFGSILLYSLANIANGFVVTVTQYAILRFIAGIGLAGELGAGITLVSETLPVKLRGYGTAIVATVGLFGAVLANFISRHFEWQTCYFIGGGLGLLLLIMRVSVFESGMFENLKQKVVNRGDFFQIFRKKERLKRFVGCILIGLPIWYTIGILITFSPEFGTMLGYTEVIKAGEAVMYSYLGLALGDLSSGLLSQWIGSRKKVVMLFILLTFLFILLYLWAPIKTADFFYMTCFCLGFGIGYWALFVTIAAEQFGTNLRATVATTVPNFIRGTVIPITFLFKFLREMLSPHYGEKLGIIYGALAVGMITIVIALLSLRLIGETFSRDLDYLETD